jgi:hypothetical protein
MNAYPLRELIPANLSPYATIKAAHRQGAVIQWNHPGSFDTAWYLAHGEEAMRGTGLDAWEHIRYLNIASGRRRANCRRWSAQPTRTTRRTARPSGR